MTDFRSTWQLTKAAIVVGSAFGIFAFVLHGTQRGVISEATASLIGAALGAGLAVLGAAYVSDMDRTNQVRQVAKFAANTLDSLSEDASDARNEVDAYLQMIREEFPYNHQFFMTRDQAARACIRLQAATHMYSKRMMRIEPHIYRLRLALVDALHLVEEDVTDVGWLENLTSWLESDTQSHGTAMMVASQRDRFDRLHERLTTARRLALVFAK